jgi:hypothetical protein
MMKTLKYIAFAIWIGVGLLTLWDAAGLVMLWNDKHHPSQPLKPPGKRMGPPTKPGEGFHGD